MKLATGSITAGVEHGLGGEFFVGHEVAQVFAFQTIEILALRRRQAERGVGDFGGEDDEIFLIHHAAFLPSGASSFNP